MNDLMDRVTHDLHAAARTVEVPTYDPLALRRRRRARLRSRSAGVVLVAAAAAGVVLGATALMPQGSVAPDGATPDRSTVAAEVPLELPRMPVIDPRSGELAIVEPDGTLVSTGLDAPEQIVGRAPDGFVVIDRESRLARYRFDDAGARAVESPYDGAVANAVASADGTELAWLDLRGRVHLLNWGGEPVVLEGGADRLWDVADGQVAISTFAGETETVAVVDAAGTQDLPAGDGFVDHVSLARVPGLAAVSGSGSTGNEIRLTDKDEFGYPVIVFGQGLMAPDGEHLLVSTAAEEESGEVTALPRESSSTPVLLMRDVSPLRMLWLDDDLVLVGLSGTDSASGDDPGELVVCEAASGACETAYDGSPLTLPTSW